MLAYSMVPVTKEPGQARVQKQLLGRLLLGLWQENRTWDVWTHFTVALEQSQQIALTPNPRWSRAC